MVESDPKKEVAETIAATTEVKDEKKHDVVYEDDETTAKVRNQ